MVKPKKTVSFFLHRQYLKHDVRVDYYSSQRLIYLLNPVLRYRSDPLYGIRKGIDRYLFSYDVLPPFCFSFRIEEIYNVIVLEKRQKSS